MESRSNEGLESEAGGGDGAIEGSDGLKKKRLTVVVGEEGEGGEMKGDEG